MLKILFVPLSIVGCGKSTVFRTLRALYPNSVHIENDNFDSKPAFYDAIASALADPNTNTVWLDRNNHLPMHRAEIIKNFQSDDVKIVALLFVPRDMLPQQIRGLALNRIVLRGDNHQQIKSTSDIRKAKMILNSFVKSFAPLDESKGADGQFDHVIEMKVGQESSEENVLRVVQFCNSLNDDKRILPALTHISPEEIKEAFLHSLAFQVASS